MNELQNRESYFKTKDGNAHTTIDSSSGSKSKGEFGKKMKEMTRSRRATKTKEDEKPRGKCFNYTKKKFPWHTS